MRRSRPPRAATLTIAAATIFSVSVLGGCAKKEDSAYACTDASGDVVDEKYCDDDYSGSGSGRYFFRSYNPSSFSGGVPSEGTYISSPNVVDATDSSARSDAGLPSTGTVDNGVVVRSGGFGSGGSGHGFGG